MHKIRGRGRPPLAPRKEKKMAKKVVGKIKLQIEAGKANPSPPVGPALGQHGVNSIELLTEIHDVNTVLT